MDNTETYIKMRLAAIPDLGMGMPPELIPNIEVTWMNTVVFVDRLGNSYYSDTEQTCQLERQDQLQEMVNRNINLTLMLHGFGDIPNLPPSSFTSWEQLWLAFVMKEKYNKVWNGEDWIK